MRCLHSPADGALLPFPRPLLLPHCCRRGTQAFTFLVGELLPQFHEFGPQLRRHDVAFLLLVGHQHRQKNFFLWILLFYLRVHDGQESGEIQFSISVWETPQHSRLSREEEALLGEAKWLPAQVYGRLKGPQLRKCHAGDSYREEDAALPMEPPPLLICLMNPLRSPQ